MLKTIAKTFQLLELLADKQNPLSLGEISGSVKTNKSTVRRFLLALIELGYVHQDPQTRFYSLTTKLVALSRGIQLDVSLPTLARPYLDTLARETGETINLAILDGTEVVYLDIRETHHRLRLHVEIGGKAPFHATALGKVIVAYMSEREFMSRFSRGMALERLTANTITIWAELDMELAQIRAEGVAFDNEELIDGLYCIGAPVFAEKEVVAGISISTPISRINPNRKELFKKLVVEQARKFSEELSFTKPFTDGTAY